MHRGTPSYSFLVKPLQQCLTHVSTFLMTLFGPDAVRSAFFHPPTLPVVEFIALAD